MKYLGLLFVIFLASCEIQEIFTKPTAREKYEKSLKDHEMVLWKAKAEEAFLDQSMIKTPYFEKIHLHSYEHFSLGYSIFCERGEVLNIGSGSTNFLVDVYKVVQDSAKRFEAAYQPFALAQEHKIEIHEKGDYFIRLQTKFEKENTVVLSVTKQPAFIFPVQSGQNGDIGSFWGDPRDGGRREHKGIDIFAKKGTPLLAVTDAKVRNVRNRGLGGKQVWLFDDDRNLSIYYAHLDSQYVSSGQTVNAGDTIGTVGNTGNARTTPPHLHFGIYVPYEGAIDPLHFVRSPKKSKPSFFDEDVTYFQEVRVNKVNRNLWQGPSKKFPILRKALLDERFEIIGVTKDWIHVRTLDGVQGYLHKNDFVREEAT